MPLYPPADRNPHCLCRLEGNFVAMCYYGHLKECHFPYPCRLAGCTHLSRYDFTAEEVDDMDAAARVQLNRGYLTGYALDPTGVVVAVERDVS